MESPSAAPVAFSPETTENLRVASYQVERYVKVTQHSGGAERYEVQAGKAKGHPLKTKPNSTPAIRA